MMTENTIKPLVAYFSMEMALDPAMPTYSGGLGVLAGDTLRAAADTGIPMVGVTLLHRKGYFRQRLDARGNQAESAEDWSPREHLEPLEPRVTIRMEGRVVQVRAWRFQVRGLSGMVPVYLLDTALDENSPWDQTLTDFLYGGDARYRLCQEVVLGMGGVAMLRALGHEPISVYHMNEGHSALLVLGLLAEEADDHPVPVISEALHQKIRQRCVFTTHTPVPAGQDQFPMDLVRKVLGNDWTSALASAQCCLNSSLNMTYLALFFSHYINGVAMRHGEISRGMFPAYPINSITNGVHAATWTCDAFQRLYDTHIPEWRRDNLYLRYAISIHRSEILQAHRQAKDAMLTEVQRRTGTVLDRTAFTLGFARRAALYKRPDFLFSDVDRLRRLAHNSGPLQVVFAGKAHPRDEEGRAAIRRIFEAAAALKDDVRVVYLEEYDLTLARLLCSGVDVWLNTPQKPQEASGTSGMKAALNGVPSFSVLDGWWIEGCLEGTTGWAIGSDHDSPSNPNEDADSLYGKLEHVILPMFYRRPLDFAEVMRSAIAINGSFFNAQRMVRQYLYHAYRTENANHA